MTDSSSAVEVAITVRQRWQTVTIDLVMALAVVAGVLGLAWLWGDARPQGRAGERDGHSLAAGTATPPSPAASALTGEGGELRAVATLDVAEQRAREVRLAGEGWVEALHVTLLGAQVHAGQRLAEIYSPSLAAAQREFLKAVARRDERAMALGRDVLRATGMTETGIDALIHKRRAADGVLEVMAPSGGVVTAINVREGMFVPLGGVLMSLLDANSAWLTVNVPTGVASRFTPGQPAEVGMMAHPRRRWRGEVMTIEPHPPGVKMVIRVDDADRALRRGTHADVTVLSQSPPRR